MKTTKYLGRTFQSSMYKTPEFVQFTRDYKSDMRTLLKGSGWEVKSFHTGHFYVSCFFHHAETDQWAYHMGSDVRWGLGDAFDRVLVRTAKHDKDYSGGDNKFCKLMNLLETLNGLNWYGMRG